MISILLFVVFKSVKEACAKHPNVSVLVNFASLRSAYDVTMETMRNAECKNIRTIAIIAEGIPENMTRRLLRVAKEKEVTIIGKILGKCAENLNFYEFYSSFNFGHF